MENYRHGFLPITDSSANQLSVPINRQNRLIGLPLFNSTAYCHAHSFIFYSLYLIFYSFYFMYTSLVLYFSIFALSMERTRLSFHCWLYNLCIVVYVTNKTWNLKLELIQVPAWLHYSQCFIGVGGWRWTVFFLTDLPWISQGGPFFSGIMWSVILHLKCGY